MSGYAAPRGHPAKAACRSGLARGARSRASPVLYPRVAVPPLGTWLLCALLAMLATGSASAEVPKPEIVIAQPGQCVADKDVMRREHMRLLRHQRDKTMREGIRTPQFSLNGCVECHSQDGKSVIDAKNGFCQSCHTYAAVKLDCFECHADRPPKGSPR